MDLSGLFITKTQATEFAQRIGNVVDALYTTNFDLEKSLTEQLGLQKKDRLMKLFFENKIHTSTKEEVKNFLQQIMTTAASTPTVELTLAFEPTEEILMSLSQWFLMQLKKQVTFAITVDYSLIAGAKITFNGKYKDYSLKPLFDQIVNTPLPDLQSASTSTTTPAKNLHQSTEFIEVGR